MSISGSVLQLTQESMKLCCTYEEMATNVEECDWISFTPLDTLIERIKYVANPSPEEKKTLSLAQSMLESCKKNILAREPERLLQALLQKQKQIVVLGRGGFYKSRA